MASWGFFEWLEYGTLLVAALLISVDQVVAGSPDFLALVGRPLVGKRSLIPVVALLIGAVSFGYQQLRPASTFDLPKGYEAGSPFSEIQAWGVNNQVYYVVARATGGQAANRLKRYVLAVQPIYSNVDPMTDTALKKSQAYTILDGFMTLAIPVTNPPVWRGAVGQSVMVRFSLIELPAIYSPDQIRSLADVEPLGGRIIAAVSALATFAAPQSAAPDAGCPATTSP